MKKRADSRCQQYRIRRAQSVTRSQRRRAQQHVPVHRFLVQIRKIIEQQLIFIGDILTSQLQSTASCLLTPTRLVQQPAFIALQTRYRLVRRAVGARFRLREPD